MRRWSTPFCNLNIETQQNIRDKLLLDRFLIIVRDIGKLTLGVLLHYFPSFFVDNFHLSWIFKSMSATTADATASAANKTRTFAWEKKWQWRAGNTRGSLAVVNDYCHHAVGCLQSFSVFKIGSLEAVVAPGFKATDLIMIITKYWRGKL